MRRIYWGSLLTWVMVAIHLASITFYQKGDVPQSGTSPFLTFFILVHVNHQPGETAIGNDNKQLVTHSRLLRPRKGGGQVMAFRNFVRLGKFFGVLSAQEGVQRNTG